MSEYEARERRLAAVTSRMRDVRASLEQCEHARKGQRAWLARNRHTLASWPAVLSRYDRLRPSDVPLAEARRFSRWARRQRWTNLTVLALRLDCAWLLFRVRTLEARRRLPALAGRNAILVLLAIVLLLGFAALFLML